MDARRIKKIKDMARNLAPETVDIRRRLHARPELAWREIETSGYVERRLAELGLTDIKRGFGGTESGVTAEIRGSQAGPCVALRADMDALPVREENDVPYRSQNEGTMHACGHDGHVAILLSAAKILASMSPELPGRVRLIFQPAEETGLPSGAAEMIEEGVLDGVDSIGGLHLWSFVETGKVQWRAGPVMASSDRLSVTIRGRGGHGAMPHAAVDPTVAAASCIGAVQTITSREIDPIDTAVVSIGKISAGDTFNVIPDSVGIMGSLRSFNPDVRGKMEERLRRIACGIASAYRCTAETEVTYMLPCVVNDPGVTNLLKETALAVVGPDMTEESPPLMVSEDFGAYLERVPGTFFFVGAGNKSKGADHPHHSPRFNIDEDALAEGAAMMASFALAAMENPRG
ncbi:MAG: amidohydrolase [Synergistaceae bacterium]|jgi:amidohydrolase|nr:amidohydrolase [Synergistaceae bacterium]